MPIDCDDLAAEMRVVCNADPQSQACILLTEMWEAICGGGSPGAAPGGGATIDEKIEAVAGVAFLAYKQSKPK